MLKLDEAQVVYKRLCDHRVEAFPNRWIKEYSYGEGSNLTIKHNGFMLYLIIYSRGLGVQISCSVYFQEYYGNNEVARFAANDSKDLPKLIEFVDDCLDRMAKMPNYVELVKREWRTL